MNPNEEIKYIGFIDDERPQFVLLITSRKDKPKMIVRMLKIKKENDVTYEAIMQSMR